MLDGYNIHFVLCTSVRHISARHSHRFVILRSFRILLIYVFPFFSFLGHTHRVTRGYMGLNLDSTDISFGFWLALVLG